MVIKKCSKCGNQFSYKEKFHSSFPRYKSLQCNACGAKYETVSFSKWLFGMLVVLPNVVRIFWPGTSAYGLVYLFYLVILSFAYPFLEFYKLKENQG